MVAVFKNVGLRFMTKGCSAVSLLSGKCKLFEKIIINRCVDLVKNVVFSVIFSII